MASISEFLSDPASAGNWTVVADQSTIVVKAKSMWGLAPVKLRFTEFGGDGQIAAPQTVSGHLDIKTASVRTGIGKRDRHLRSADFFEAERFPDISVVVTGAEGDQGRRRRFARRSHHQKHDETGDTEGQSDAGRRRRNAPHHTGNRQPP